MQRVLPALLLACGLAGHPAESVAAPPIPGAQSYSGARELQPGRLEVDSKRIALAPISVSELAPRNQTALALAPRIVTREGSALQFSGNIDPPPLNPVVRRELRDLWRYAPREDGASALMPPGIRAELRSLDGRSGFLSSTRSPQARVPVNVRITQELRRGARGERWYEGSVVLEIPIAALIEAGTYSGRIELNQESL